MSLLPGQSTGERPQQPFVDYVPLPSVLLAETLPPTEAANIPMQAQAVGALAGSTEIRRDEACVPEIPVGIALADVLRKGVKVPALRPKIEEALREEGEHAFAEVWGDVKAALTAYVSEADDPQNAQRYQGYSVMLELACAGLSQLEVGNELRSRGLVPDKPNGPVALRLALGRLLPKLFPSSLENQPRPTQRSRGEEASLYLDEVVSRWPVSITAEALTVLATNGNAQARELVGRHMGNRSPVLSAQELITLRGSLVAVQTLVSRYYDLRRRMAAAEHAPSAGADELIREQALLSLVLGEPDTAARAIHFPVLRLDHPESAERVPGIMRRLLLGIIDLYDLKPSAVIVAMGDIPNADMTQPPVIRRERVAKKLEAYPYRATRAEKAARLPSLPDRLQLLDPVTRQMVTMRLGISATPLSFSEIAQAHGVDKTTAMRRVHTALQDLGVEEFLDITQVEPTVRPRKPGGRPW